MIYLDNTLLWLWLHENSNISRNKQYKLLEAFGDIESIYKSDIEDYRDFSFLSPEDINALHNKDLGACEKSFKRLLDMNARVLTTDSPDYPDMLRTIHSAPTVLYTMGSFCDFNNAFCIAMVGTRLATDYGKKTAYNIARDLSKNGVTVVSGLAAGIDAKSHEGALSSYSPTVAVTACGLDIVYPKLNSDIMKKIVKQGAVVTEYPLGSPPEKYHFPERNRIISGLCHGTVVVEADIKSGSLITSDYATEQNRDVFAVPGNVSSSKSKGTNFLLRDGAHMITSGRDILDFYSLAHLEEVPKTNIEFTPDPLEERVLSAITEDSVHTDVICERTGLDAGTVNATLLMLELKGKVMKLSGGRYSSINN